MTKKTNSTTAYKGFDKDLKCQDVQFEIGKTYEQGEESDHKSGFYACENPLDVFKYYPPTCRFAVVKCDGEISKDIDGRKTTCGKLTIEKEIGLPELTSEATKWIYTKVDWENRKIDGTGNQSVASNMGYRSAVLNTGIRSVACNTGDWSVARNTGDWSIASNTGYQSAASSKGYQSVASSTGEMSAASNTGNYSAASSTGIQSVARNTGDWSVASNTGKQSVASNTGNYSAASSTGYRSEAEVSGFHSVASNTGELSAASSTGNYSAASNTGELSVAKVSGLHSVACALGAQSKVKAAAGSAIVCVYRNDDGDLIHIRAAKVGDDGIKADTWYTLDDTGEFVECE